MSSRRFTTEFVIKGDSTSAVQASRDLQRANSDLAREIENTERQSEEMAASFESVSMHAQRLATVTAAATAATGAMVVSQTRNIAEQAAFARAVGVSVQTLQQWEFAAKAAGMQSGAIGDIFKDTAEKIGDFVNTGGGEAADLFEVLNLNIRDLMDLSPDKQLLAVANAFDEVGNRGAKIAFLESLGNDATLLLPLLENNAELLREQLGIADQLSVAIPQSDVDSIEAANQALNELTALASGFSSTVAANFAPSIVAMSQGTQELVGDLGGMSEVVDKVATGTLLVSGLLGGRLASSMATATAATLAKLSADRSARLADAAASAANAKRTAETLRIAQSEQLAAQRAFESARAIAIATGNTTLRTKAITQMAAANQRAIAAEAAHTAAVNASSAAMARSTVAAQGMSVAARAGASAYAMLGGPLGLLVGAGGLLYAFREEIGLVRQAVEPTTERIDNLTDAINRNSVAAVEAGIVNLSAEYFTLGQRAAAITAEIERLNAAQENDRQGAQARLQNNMRLRDLREELAQIVTEQEAAGEASTRLRETLEGLGETAVPTTNSLTDLGDASETAARKAQQSAEAQAKALAGVQQEMDPLLADYAEYVERLAVLDRALAEGTISEEAYGEAVRWNAEQYQRAATGAEEYEKQSKSLISTYDSHNQKAQQLRDALAQINQMYRAGEIDGDQYARMVGGIREEMQQLALDADPAAQEMARAWEEASNRIDETFADAFAGAFDSFDDFTDQLLDGFKRLLAELAYQATLKPIVVQFTQQMGSALGIPGVGGQGGGGGMGGFNLSPGGISNAWNMVQNGFTGNGIGSGMASAANSAYSFFSGASGASALAMEGGLSSAAITSANQVASNPGWLNNPSNVSNISFGLQSIGGSYVGNELGSAAFGKQANSNVGATLGAIGGSFLPIPGGTFIGSTIGGMLDSLFGSSEKTFDFDFLQGQHSYVFGDGTSAFGDYGLTRLTDYKLGEQQDQLKEMLAALGEFDNQIAANATAERFEAMKEAIDGFTHSGAEDLFETRLREMITGGEVWAAEAVASITDPEKLAQGMLGALQLEQVGVRLGSELSAEIQAAISGARGDGAADVVNSVMAQAQAAELLVNSVERLNLQFDVTAEGALGAAGNISQLVGGVQNLASLQSRYYNAFFSEEEKLENMASDLADAFSSLGLSLPSTEQGVREMVSGIDQMTAAGQEQYAAVLQLVPQLDQYIEGLREHGSAMSLANGVITHAVSDSLDAYNEQISSIEDIADARREQLQDEQRAVEQLSSLMNSLMLSDQSILDPMERMQEAQRQLAELQIRADAGDTDAVGQLQGASNAYLESVAAVYGQASSQYAAEFKDVTTYIRSLEDQYGDSLAALGSIESIEQRALREQQRAYDVLMRSLDEQVAASAELGTLSELLSALPGELADALSGIIENSGSDAGGGGSGASSYIDDIYNDVLGRNADSEGAAYWESTGLRGDALRDAIEYSAWVDGSHYSGLARVPFDGYIAELHKDETVLNRHDAEAWRQQQLMPTPAALPMPNLPPMQFPSLSNQPAAPAINIEPLLRKIDALTQEVAQLRGERSSDAKKAADQRGEQLREQQKANRHAKTRVPTV